MTQVFDFIQIIHQLSDELRKYEQNPTPEKEAQLEQWIMGTMHDRDFELSLIESIKEKRGFVPQHRGWAFAPSTTSEERELGYEQVDAAEEKARQEEEAKKAATLQGYALWSHYMNYPRALLETRFVEAFPDGKMDLPTLQALVIQPNFHEFALPLAGEGKYITLSKDDIAKIRDDWSFIRVESASYQSSYVPYIAKAVGINVDANGSAANIEDPTLFEQAVTTPAYQELIGRLIRSTATLSPTQSRAIRDAISGYLAEHNDLLKQILPVYTAWFALL
ncbi:Hypothetical protein POVN_LOCUS699 [uncultured virus]|nr:Hypothetical protein POVN_LOCUS699 [uncultured virus]